MKKSKLFAPFLMLFAGATASIMMYFFKYTTKQMLLILLVVLVVFYILGLVIQKKVTSFVEQIKAQEEQEGEVIEKDTLSDATDEESAQKTDEDNPQKAEDKTPQA